MKTDSSWYQTPEELLGEMRRHEAVFRRPLRIAGYEDVHEVRRGGQGVVYSAIQGSTKRRVAIKVLFDDAASPETRRRRFEREIELVSALKHPNIVPVYDSGVTSDDRMYFIMAYVDGLPLDEFIRQQHSPDNLEGAASLRPLSAAQILQLFAKICTGVSHAHLRGVIHRDLKPSNIRIDGAGEPHVLDFGVARPVNGTAAQPLTCSGHFLGTLAYAAPEQLQGDPSQVDIRSDIYSLGVILYEMLTGRLPYRTGGPVQEAIEAITRVQPAPPSQMIRSKGSGSGLQLKKRMEADLDTIVLKTLEKDPDRRYQSAEGLRCDVLRCLEGHPIEARRDSAWYVLRKMLWRHKLAVSSVAAILILLTTFGVAMGVMYRHAETEAAKFKSVNLFLEDTLYSLKDPAVGPEVTLRELLDESRHFLGLLADQPEVEAAVRTTIGNSYRSIRRFEEAETHLVSALETRREILGDDHLDVARSLNALAFLRQAQGRLIEAEQLFREALSVRRRLLGEFHPDVATTIGNLALCLSDAGDYEQAEMLLREQLDIRLQVRDADDPAIPLVQYNLAEVLRSQGNLERAAQMHRQCYDQRLQILEQDHPDLNRSRLALGILLVDLGHPQEAELLLTQCLESRIQSLAPDHPLIAEAQQALDRCLTDLGSLEPTPFPGS